MSKTTSAEVLRAYLHVIQKGLTPTEACKVEGISRSNLYRYKPFKKWLAEQSK